MKRTLCVALSLIFLVSALAGCCITKKQSPEIGKWHGEVKLSEVTESMSGEYQFLLTLIAGSTAFEADVEFYEDGTFAFSMNADKMKEAISSSVSTVAGFFIDQDISAFTDRIIEAAVSEVLLGSDTECYGTYTFDDNSITAIGDDNTTLYFEIKGKTLYLVDEYGDTIMRFSKLKEES